MKKSNSLRLPRPIGVTQMMKEYHSTNDIQILDKVRHFYINYWITNNGSICGKGLDSNQLAAFLKCNPEDIRVAMKERLLNTKIWDKENQEELISSLMGQQVVWALEDRMEASQQLELLKASQRGTYQPFITEQVNKALGLKFSTTTTLQSIVRGLFTSGTINIFQNNQQQNIVQGITMEQATHIVQQEMSHVDRPQEVQYIEANYALEELPEVVATKQLGVSTDKEGLNFGSVELMKIADTYHKALPEDHHDTRRERELEVDMGEIDPELDIYPDEVPVL